MDGIRLQTMATSTAARRDRWSELTLVAGLPHQPVLSLGVVAHASPSFAKSSQVLPSTEVIEVCGICDGPILKWELRIAVGEPAHASCLYPIGGLAAALTKPSPMRPAARTPEQVEYARRLRRIHTGTLSAMVNEYDACPDERLPEHAWQIKMVAAELDDRLMGHCMVACPAETA